MSHVEPDRGRFTRALQLKKRHPADAISEFKILASEGSIPSMLQLGWAYYKGDGASEDLDEAEAWYRKAMEAGSLYASYRVGAVLKRKGDFKGTEFVSHGGRKKTWSISESAWGDVCPWPRDGKGSRGRSSVLGAGIVNGQLGLSPKPRDVVGTWKIWVERGRIWLAAASLLDDRGVEIDAYRSVKRSTPRVGSRRNDGASGTGQYMRRSRHGPSNRGDRHHEASGLT